MKSRLATVSLASCVMLLITYTNLTRPFESILDVFCWLAYLLIVACIVLWPKTGKDTRAESAHRTGAWSERIDFDKLGGTRGS